MLNRLCMVLFLLAVLPLPANTQTVYDNGPINGTTDAWTINSGFAVSDTFTVPGGGAGLAGLVFGAWLFPGDVLQSAQVTITSSLFGGTTYLNEVASFTQSGCSGNQYGFNICTETASFSGPFLGSGTYWLSLENAVVNTGDPVYWDENSGPSRAVDFTNGSLGQAPPNATAVGTIPSEAFTLLGQGTTCGADGCAPSQTVPEPAGLVSLCAGALTLFGFSRGRRRKQF